MDLPLFLRVLWRFRFLAVLGAALALGLAFFSYVQVGFSGYKPTFSYREREHWQSEATLFITQPGFPWGRSVLPVAGDQPTDSSAATTATGTSGKPKLQFADPARFGDLATLYATLATSEPVRDIMRRSGAIRGTLAAAPVLSTDSLPPQLRAQLRYATALPLLRITATSSDPHVALELAQRDVSAFVTYLERQQRASSIPQKDRVRATVLESPQQPEIADGRSKIYPTLILVGVLMATLALAFVLESIWPRRRQNAVEQRLAAAMSDASTTRRSA